jgi:transcriptional regulator with XRE-family HTH domain
MGFGDVAARMKAKKAAQEEAEKSAPGKVADPAEGFRLRGKMLGVLLRDARVAAGHSLEDCADLLKTTSQQIEAWEFGDEVPSLPQLEILAYFLGVPVSHFWGLTTLEATRGGLLNAQTEYISLRTRMIGALLRQAREELGTSLEELSAATNIPVENLNQYELGEYPIPMHELSVLSGSVRKNMSYFLESSSHIGELLALKEEWKHFTTLPEDLRQFAANPVNIGFIRIAYLFAKMPVEQLRQIGESIVDITL